MSRDKAHSQSIIHLHNDVHYSCLANIPRSDQKKKRILPTLSVPTIHIEVLVYISTSCSDTNLYCQRMLQAAETTKQSHLISQMKKDYGYFICNRFFVSSFERDPISLEK